MLKKKIWEDIWALCDAAIKPLGFEVIELEYFQSKQSIVRVFVDHSAARSDQRVTIEDCARASHAIDAVLEQSDPVPSAYTLEVSSPGIERPLRRPADFQKLLGQTVRVRTQEKVDGRGQFTGCLSQVDAAGVGVMDGERIVHIPFDNLKKATLVVADLAAVAQSEKTGASSATPKGAATTAASGTDA